MISEISYFFSYTNCDRRFFSIRCCCSPRAENDCISPLTLAYTFDGYRAPAFERVRPPTSTEQGPPIRVLLSSVKPVQS